MPSAQRASTKALGDRTLVLDNGGYSIKAGFVQPESSQSQDCRLIQNCIARGRDGPRGSRIYIGDELDACKDFAEMSFRRPVEKGYLVNWDAELDIWKQALFNKNAGLHCDPHDTNLVLTEASNCPQALQQNTDQVVFEELQFASAYRCTGPALNAFNEMPASEDNGLTNTGPAECFIVVDSGYSHTTVMPMLRDRPIHSAIRRLDIGGRFLTNRLKELISHRQFNLMDDTHLVNQIKEDVCFVSQEFKGDIERSWQVTGAAKKSKAKRTDQDSSVLDYVLPDYITTYRGYSRPFVPQAPQERYASIAGPGGHKPKEDSFPLANERFAVPELLFAPSDVGLAQAGIAETIVQSLECIPPGLWPAAVANVLVVGGNACLPGFVERLQAELRILTPAECHVQVRKPTDPITASWRGGIIMASDPSRLQGKVVTKHEYQEHGAAWTARQFRAA